MFYKKKLDGFVAGGGRVQGEVIDPPLCLVEFRRWFIGAPCIFGTEYRNI